MNIKEVRKNAINLPIEMVKEVFNKPVENGNILQIADKKNAKTVIDLWEKCYKEIDKKSHTEVNMKELSYLLRTVFQPQLVTIHWWKQYNRAVEKCIIEIYNPFETLT